MNAEDKSAPKGGKSNMPAIIGAVVIVVLFILAGWYYSNRGEAPQTQATGTGTTQEASESADTAKPAEESKAADQAADKAKDEAAAEVAPSFDTVRVEPSGEAVIAGRAAPGATVMLYANSEQIGEVVADATGSWVFVLDKPLSSGPNDLWVSAEKGGAAVRSKQSVAVVVDPGANTTPLVVVQDEGGSRVLQKETEVASAGKPEMAEEKPETGGDAKPEMADGKAPGSDAPAPTVVIEAADYDEASGNLVVAGEAAPGATVRVYYDNEHLGDAVAGDDGRWSLRAGRPLDGATHALRADLVGADSAEVSARAEVSFIAQLPEETKVAEAGKPDMADGEKPEMAEKDGAQVAAASAKPEEGGTTGEKRVVPDTSGGDEAQAPRKIEVTRGDNLWRIARSIYGSGIRYTVIYKANKNQIRNPHLIYPGQVFIVPRRVEDAGK